METPLSVFHSQVCLSPLEELGMDLGMSGDGIPGSGPCAMEPPVSRTSTVSLSPVSYPIGSHCVVELSWLLRPGVATLQISNSAGPKWNSWSPPNLPHLQSFPPQVLATPFHCSGWNILILTPVVTCRFSPHIIKQFSDTSRVSYNSIHFWLYIPEGSLRSIGEGLNLMRLSPLQMLIVRPGACLCFWPINYKSKVPITSLHSNDLLGRLTDLRKPVYNPRRSVSAELVLRLMESQTIFIIDTPCFYPAPKALLKLPT